VPRRNHLDSLMRRAKRGADELLCLAQSGLPPDGLAALRQLSWPITSVNELRKGRAILLEKARLSCRDLKPERAIPILVDATSRHYSLTHSATAHAPWLGPALKTCMTLTWPSVHTVGAGSCTTRGLWKSIGICAAHQQLHWTEFLFVFAGGRGQVDLAPDGLTFSDELLEVQGRLARASSDHETGLRSPGLGAGTLAANLPATHRAILSALSGTPAAAIEHLRRTPLAAIPPSQGEALLAHLWLTSELAHRVNLKSTLLHGHNEGVVLVPDPVWIRFPEQIRHRVTSVSRLLFWTKDWFDSLGEDDLTNAIVERPLLRCDYNGDFYATSLIFVLDALAWGIEAAFFGYPRMEMLRLPEDARHQAFSHPHEDRVINVCRAAGLYAGPVSGSGVWQNQSGTENLGASSRHPCPGQVDCLALTSDRRTAFVFECKVLRLPHTYSVLRNVVGKLGVGDEKGFHANLTQKAKWLATALGAQHIQTALVVDRAVPLLEYAPHPVVLVSELNNYLAAQSLSPALSTGEPCP